jgi:cytochrome c peroxidase
MKPIATTTIARLALAIGLGVAVAQVATAQEPIKPITPPSGINQPAAELGKKLYFDARLSKSGFISCNSCHNLSMGGTDNLPTSIGHGWSEGPINSPTVLNSSYNVAQFWDGRATDLQAQAGGPIANPGEMASSHPLALEVIQSIPGYVDEFQQVYGSAEVTIEGVTAAIAEFEKTLVTPNSRFDRWLSGDQHALNAEEKAGYDLFKSVGCVGCHNGPAVGGAMFMKLGMVAPYQTANKAEGRVAVTHNESDRNVFKVPTLRNVALTYPYFHDGAVRTLPAAVDIMAKVQLGRTLSADETASITAFLLTLTGDQPQFTLPILPPSTAATPAPEPFN